LIVELANQTYHVEVALLCANVELVGDRGERVREGLGPFIQAWEGISLHKILKFPPKSTESYWNTSVPDTNQGGSFRHSATSYVFSVS